MTAAARTAMVVSSVVGTVVVAVVMGVVVGVVVVVVGAFMTVAVSLHAPLVFPSAVRSHALLPLSKGMTTVVSGPQT